MVKHLLKELFYETCSRYCRDSSIVGKYWDDLVDRYSEQHRAYHNLKHLAAVWKQLQPVWQQLQQPDGVLLALFYHDYIYDVLRNDNEAASALAATEVLTQLQISPPVQAVCRACILATKDHYTTGHPDIDLFTDADLSILGATHPVYTAYATAIRKEYGIYPDEVYRQGRLKVLDHFLAMPSIFKTGYFTSNLEASARYNLQQ